MPMEKGEEKIDAMKQMYNTLGIKEAAEVAINELYGQALGKLKDLNLSPNQMEQIEAFSNKLVKRIK